MKKKISEMKEETKERELTRGGQKGRYVMRPTSRQRHLEGSSHSSCRPVTVRPFLSTNSTSPQDKWKEEEERV